MNKANKDDLFIQTILAVANVDALEYIIVDQDKTIAVICNDLFDWGCADCEPIETFDDLDLFKACAKIHNGLCLELYCCRKRNMRPQGAYYKNIPDGSKNMFDECGPVRDIDYFNPEDNTGKYLFKLPDEEIKTNE